MKNSCQLASQELKKYQGRIYTSLSKAQMISQFFVKNTHKWNQIMIFLDILQEV